MWFPFFHLDLGSFIYQALSDAIGSTTIMYFYLKSGLLRYNLHAIVVVVQSLSHVWLCDPMGCSMPDFPVLHQLLAFAQTYVHWVNDAISVTPFSSCSQSFPVSGSFPMSWFFASGGKNIGISASVLPMNIQDWFPLGWTGLISLKSKVLSRVFSNTTVQKPQFFSTQPSSQSNSLIKFSWTSQSE